MATILRTANLGQLLESMSSSITGTLRTNPHANMVPGLAYQVEMFIDVRWPWITLPVIVTLGSIALLLGTAIGSKQQKTVPWKCTVLPLPLCSVTYFIDNLCIENCHTDIERALTFRVTGSRKRNINHYPRSKEIDTL